MNVKPKNNAKKNRHNWKWGKDFRNCLGAARETNDPVLLAKMVSDILTNQTEDDGEISEELICNNCLPFAEALKLARHWGGRFAYDLCNRLDSTTEAIEEFSEHFDAIEAEVFIDNPNIGSGVRRKLADQVSPAAIVWMIEHGEIPNDELPKYINHKNAFVRAAIAAKIKDEKILQQMSADGSIEVRESAVNNPAIAVEIAEELAIRGDSLTAKVVAAMRTEKPQVLLELAKKLADPEDAPVAKAIKENKLAPDCETTRAALVLATLH